jgi:histidine ammonia-lyase
VTKEISMRFILHPGELKVSDLRILLDESTTLELHPDCLPGIHAAEKVITSMMQAGKTVYGINTGFGGLANTNIQVADLENLQRNLVLSTATGTGTLLSDQAVRLILALKVNSLARGYSGVRLQTIEALIRLYNAKIYPCIPSQGSVGASGDLAPLAHLSAVLIGVGEARYQGQLISAQAALDLIKQMPLQLAPKEGLALLNGTQVSTSLAILGLLAADDVFVTALIAGAMSVEASRGADAAFDERIQAVRGHATQIKVARILRELLQNSDIRRSHHEYNKVQDPYSLRCQPQVMGACLSQLLHSSKTLLVEANAVSDNPLIFADQDTIISGGNFHAEPIAMAADNMAISIAEIGALSERRIALLVDTHFSGLPAFLVTNAGLHSGFMMAQVTAASLASENKSLAHPASVDSIPTSANQEDHVSMATFAARRLLPMTENVAVIVGIELLAACQGLDFLRPLKTSPPLEKIYQLVRKTIPFYDKDRFFAPDIANIKALIQSGQIREQVSLSIFTS